MSEHDTIAAIATPMGCGGIGIVRMSGSNAQKIIANIFRNSKNERVEDFVPRMMNYGFIIDTSTGEVVDEVLMVFMKSPSTYTKEDVVEINCHGGNYSLSKILSVLLNEGARVAEPGEFTKRAFLNGRIDLTQAEAVIDFINARTEASAKNSLSQLKGRLSVEMEAIRNQLIGLLADIEATNDFPEYDIEEKSSGEVWETLTLITKQLEELLVKSEKGRLLKEGLNTVIVGKPNVGKSSLLNELLGQEKAIVTDIPGTTRDIIEEFISIGGVPLKIHDTAGIRETEDVIEKIGVNRAQESLEKAELILLVLDGSNPLTKSDKEIMGKIKNRNVIVLINKSDRGIVVDENEIKKLIPDKKILTISAKERKGLEQLEKEIIDMFFEGNLETGHDIMVTNIRQRDLIKKTVDSLKEGIRAIDMKMPLDCVSIDIKTAADSLGALTGAVVTEDVVNEIFSRFCVGK